MAFVLVQHLAPDRKEKAIAVVLSGTGSDGALGLRAVKGEGGMLMVQSPESPEFDGMPRSAISTGLADYVLPPSEMADALISYSLHAFAAVSSGEKANSLRTIFKMLRSHSGHDFSHYKPNTVLRRIERRLALLQLDSIENYVERIRQETEELDALFLWKGRCKTRRETGFQCAFCPTEPWTML